MPKGRPARKFEITPSNTLPMSKNDAEEQLLDEFLEGRYDDVDAYARKQGIPLAAVKKQVSSIVHRYKESQIDAATIELYGPDLKAVNAIIRKNAKAHPEVAMKAIRMKMGLLDRMAEKPAVQQQINNFSFQGGELESALRLIKARKQQAKDVTPDDGTTS